MKRFEKFSFAYAWQVAAVIMLFGFPGRSEIGKSKDTTPENLEATIKMDPMKDQRIDLLNERASMLNISDRFIENTGKEFAVKFNTIGIAYITLKKP